MTVRAAPHTERLIEWVTGGDFAVAVEVEAVFPADAPTEACFRPKTVRWLEHLAECAEKGDLATLEQAGRVYELRASSTAR